MSLQTCSRVLMIRPCCPGYNIETAESNAFQHASPVDAQTLLREFDHMVSTLKNAGVDLWLVSDTSDEEKPDAHFPNNWVSFHSQNRAVIYPMLSASRRKERRMDLLLDRKILDLTIFEAEEAYLEGTGSVVVDRKAQVAYAAASPRTHPRPFEHFCAAFELFPILFEAKDAGGKPIYHTNVLMSIGENFALVCTEAMTQPNRIVAELRMAGKEIIEISLAQMLSFAGNLLQVNSSKGPLIVISDTAFSCLDDRQLRQLEDHGTLLPIAIPNIEKVGGGSVRCMLAEVF